VDVAGDGEGIQEYVPEGIGDRVDGVHENEEYQAEDDHDYGCAVAAFGDCGEHEGEVPEKEHGEYQLGGHFEYVDRIQQQAGDVGEDDEDEIVGDVYHEHADAPYFVAVVGYAEDDFEDAVVFVVLYAEYDRVEDEQQAGEQQQAVYGTFVDFTPVPCLLEHEKCKKSKCGHEEPEKLTGKYDFQIVPDDFYDDRYKIF
jgi:hypothetical protein